MINDDVFILSCFFLRRSYCKVNFSITSVFRDLVVSDSIFCITNELLRVSPSSCVVAAAPRRVTKYYNCMYVEGGGWWVADRRPC